MVFCAVITTTARIHTILARVSSLWGLMWFSEETEPKFYSGDLTTNI